MVQYRSEELPSGAIWRVVVRPVAGPVGLGLAVLKVVIAAALASLLAFMIISAFVAEPYIPFAMIVVALASITGLATVFGPESTELAISSSRLDIRLERFGRKVIEKAVDLRQIRRVFVKRATNGRTNDFELWLQKRDESEMFLCSVGNSESDASRLCAAMAERISQK